MKTIAKRYQIAIKAIAITNKKPFKIIDLQSEKGRTIINRNRKNALWRETPEGYSLWNIDARKQPNGWCVKPPHNYTFLTRCWLQIWAYLLPVVMSYD